MWRDVSGTVGGGGSNGRWIVVSPDSFNAYKQIVLSLPSNRYLGERILMDRVRTAPSVNASGRALEKAAHFDTAFVAEDLALYKTEGGISGDFF